MGFFSKIGGDLELAAGVALIVTGGPLGILAGSVMVGSFAASKGLFGKGAENFANSAAGHDVVLAVGLATAAADIYSVANAGAPASSGAVDANVAATPTGGAGAAGDAAATPNLSTLQNAPETANLGASLTSNDTVVTGINPGEATAANNAVATGNGATLTPGQATEMVNNPGSTDAVSTATQAVAPQTPSQMAQTEGLQGPGGAAAGPQPGMTTGPGGAAGATPATGIKGLLGKAGDALSSPTGMMMGASAASGLAQGIMGQKASEQAIAAQQWPNLQWNDPTKTAGVTAAAAAPITVPQGYLNRAAAVRQMMNGSTNQTTPLQGSATPAAPAPTVAPVGMTPPPGASAPGGPVPVYQMNSVPRGGAI